MFGGLTIKGCELSLCSCNKLESEEQTKTSRRLLNSELYEKFLLLKNTVEIEYLDQHLIATEWHPGSTIVAKMLNRTRKNKTMSFLIKKIGSRMF